MGLWICDVNGVLIDSSAIVRRAFIETLGTRWRTPTEHELRILCQLPLLEAYRRVATDGDPFDCCQRHFHYLCRHSREARTYRDVTVTLARATASGVRVAAVTSYGAFAEACLVRTGLYSFLSCIVTQEEVMRPKPDPEFLLTAMAICGAGCAPFDPPIYVGDTPLDIEAGKAAGIRTAAATYGFGDGPALRRARPDYTIRSFGEMLSLADRLEAARAGAAPRAAARHKRILAVADCHVIRTRERRQRGGNTDGH